MVRFPGSEDKAIIIIEAHITDELYQTLCNSFRPIMYLLLIYPIYPMRKLRLRRVK